MRKVAVPTFLMLLGVLLVAAGIGNGQPELIMQKAIRICLECVGIG